MKSPLASKRPPTPALPTPQQLYAEAAADTDYSQKACLRSLGSRRLVLSGPEAGLVPTIAPVPNNGLLSRLSAMRRRASQKQTKGPFGPLREAKDEQTYSYAVASIVHAEPGLWKGKKAHFIRVHVAFYPDTEHYLQRVSFTIRVWKAGEALKSVESISHLQLLNFDPPHAPEFGSNAPGIVLYSPRAVIGRPASAVEPFWEGHFQPGEHFVYFADALPPVNYASAGRLDSKQSRSLLRVVAFGNDEEKYPAPHLEIGFVVLSEGKPFDLTASSTSLHWGWPAIRRYLFTPYKPARFTSTTRLIPKGEKGIRADFGQVAMRESLKKMMGWATAYDTVGAVSQVETLDLRTDMVRGSSWLLRQAKHAGSKLQLEPVQNMCEE